MYGVELYAAVRLAVVDEGLSHHEAGRRFGIDRRTVKKMLSYSAPPGYRRTKPVRRPKLDGFTGIVDAILEADTDPDVPRKQRHTAHRIFERGTRREKAAPPPGPARQGQPADRRRARIPDLFPVSFPGVKTSRDGFLVDVDLDRLRSRLADYFDATLTHEEIARRYPPVMKTTARFDAGAVRDTLLAPFIQHGATM